MNPSQNGFHEVVTPMYRRQMRDLPLMESTLIMTAEEMKCHPWNWKFLSGGVEVDVWRPEWQL